MTHRDRETLEAWIEIGRAELAREIDHVRYAEGDFDEDIVERTPHLKEIADRLNDMITEYEGW